MKFEDIEAGQNVVDKFGNEYTIKPLTAALVSDFFNVVQPKE